MIKFGLFFCALLIFPSVFAQSIDVRRSLWGATSGDVKKAELPLTPFLEKDSNCIAQKQANKIVSFHNVIVEKQMANIDYFFRNDQLVAISFTIFQKKDSISTDLYSKLVKIQGIYNKMVQYKSMKPVYCWTYDNGSFKQQSGKVSCTFADQVVAGEVEKYGLTLKYINRALFVLGNERTLASFEFDIKNNDKTVLCWLNFSPTNKVEQTIQSSDF
jgi:hypothetical protein